MDEELGMAILDAYGADLNDIDITAYQMLDDFFNDEFSDFRECGDSEW